MSPNQLSDEILIGRVAQGDKAALEMLYDRHAAIVLGICLKILGERTTAETVLQETFWQVWQRAPAYSSQNVSLLSWLFRTARNVAISSLDQAKMHPREITEKANFDLQGKQVPNLAEDISLEQRQIVEMAYFHGMTRQQIAEATGQTLDAVHSLARLGLQKLMEVLKAKEEKLSQHD